MCNLFRGLKGSSIRGKGNITFPPGCACERYTVSRVYSCTLLEMLVIYNSFAWFLLAVCCYNLAVAACCYAWSSNQTGPFPYNLIDRLVSSVNLAQLVINLEPC